MIEVFFDNNALKMLFTNCNFDDYVLKIKKLGEQKKLRAWFNFINFQERLLGANSQYYHEVQEYLRKAYAISGGAILLAPEPHLKSCAKVLPYLNTLTPEQIKSECATWTEYFRKLVNIKSFDEFTAFAGRLMNYYIDFKKEVLLGARSLKQNMSDSRKKGRSAAKKTVFAGNAQELLQLRQQLFLRKLNSWHLIKEGAEHDPIELTLLFPSVLYFVDVNLHYYFQMFSGGFTPKESDYFDFEQVIYFDRCDYMVTEDKQLTGIIENCGNSDLSNRTITVSEFLAMVEQDGDRLSKRAPHRLLTTVRVG